LSVCSAVAKEVESGFRVCRYDPSLRSEWDRFLSTAKNTTFMFRRDYMDYHAERFEDHSLIIWRGTQVMGLLPANLRADGVLVSHQGLTYGGFVLRREITLGSVLDVVRASLHFLHQRAVPRLIYKRLPRFYNTLPDDDVDYALFLMDSKLIRRDCSLAICRSDRLPVSRGKKSKINKGKRAGVIVKRDDGFQPFWTKVLTPRLLQRFGVAPVHTIEEITGLADRLPEHIKQYSAYLGDEIVAGVTVYETPTVAHMQYIAVTDKGEEVCALEYLFHCLIEEVYPAKVYFDFGICNERDGRELNRGLLQFKEGFGARTFSHDFYEIETANVTRLI